MLRWDWRRFRVSGSGVRYQAGRGCNRLGKGIAGAASKHIVSLKANNPALFFSV